MKTLNGICRICGKTRAETNNNFMASGTICYNCYVENYEKKEKRSVSRFGKKQ